MTALWLAVAAAAPSAPNPTADPAVLTAAEQWRAIAACPRVSTLTGSTRAATGVVVAVRDGDAIVLTADHASPGTAEREVQFFTRDDYPAPSARLRGVRVDKRWVTPDVALLRVRVGDRPVGVLPLAAPGERPKRFPFDAVSVGCTDGRSPSCRAERVVAKRAARRPGGLAFFWELATPPDPGRSGGPLVSADGRVIGLCTARRDGKGYFTHADEILAALADDNYGWVWRPGR